MSDNIYADIALRIVEEQEEIIGPIAAEQANRVTGLHINSANHTAEISGDNAKVIDALVGLYKEFFGPAAVETCKEAASKLLPKLNAAELPKSLQ